ncbi:uncharacterized protein EDB93DRAFT_1107539 [Suillus bovinus]|uniref:uncharacterized protein n=1 Tax=Suillus bovinus TaxID=48563 RepID=UPI001B875E30|nr:uncharacterized protein EDB93DRAFT_1107539 [Suillus bovinus]KAG2133592.1 hypothetical protein EDB93DRAFT_1107539 [Suillus bovinus]
MFLKTLTRPPMMQTIQMLRLWVWRIVLMHYSGVMANLDDDNSDSDDDNAAQAAPPASIGPSGIYDSAPALPTAPPAPCITISPSTAPTTAPAPQSRPAAIQVAVASVEGVSGEGEDTKIMAQKKGRRKGKAVVASTDVAPRRSSCNGVA